MKVFQLLRVLLYGWMILLAAILVNVLANTLGVATWYDYVMRISELGLKTATLSLGLHEYIFLIVIYPCILGIVVYLVRFAL